MGLTGSVGRTQVMYDRVMDHTDAGDTVGDAVVTFDGVAVLAPRGRFEVELYLSFMKLLGQVMPAYLPTSTPLMSVRIQCLTYTVCRVTHLPFSLAFPLFRVHVIVCLPVKGNSFTSVISEATCVS